MHYPLCSLVLCLVYGHVLCMAVGCGLLGKYWQSEDPPELGVAKTPHEKSPDAPIFGVEGESSEIFATENEIRF